MEYAFVGVFLYIFGEKGRAKPPIASGDCALAVFYEITTASCTRQEEDARMETTPPPTRPAWEHRLHAVLALLGGEPVPQVTARFGMGRSILYK
jgi:hypothetical protein